MRNIKTPRTRLRGLVTEDLTSLIELMQDNDIVKHTGWRKPMAEDIIAEKLEAWKALEGNLGVWGAEHLADKELVGWFMMRYVEDQAPELGFMIRKKYWQQGFASEIAGTLLDYGHHELKLQKILAQCDRTNIASQKTLERCGMSLVREDDETCFYESCQNY
ncbi:GNAT family N-acetyltransferase [Pseudobacteriovorax antillogorgiicola]|uniref:Protein N-acetyltransferase, RimJ/RimL family n=1 Tax=Pseudobacteriovorax antillogorgiicola TaxID=1513793 RepID=A0A1Y6CKQ4_9BACT|nr:GNAT family N-acetyltransferase [Pseudobacteriovorax antillogorgiicola]TCS47612.1 RimJ/RimL family protein N-acetyltransferase [Pseudobacteriovorax antillogorgiicola]SMF60073.1 Protein N-acetyltransferase, RimJ/RimL family [Pseudobacteriovorax antillogorgiicola]